MEDYRMNITVPFVMMVNNAAERARPFLNFFFSREGTRKARRSFIVICKGLQSIYKTLHSLYSNSTMYEEGNTNTSLKKTVVD
jgi:hypothetical protein